MSKAETIFEFLKLAEKLKTELRHSWLSDPARQESVAEHTWMALLFVILLFDEVKQPVDQLRVLKILIIHDLAEAIIGDIPVFEISDRKINKQDAERKAMKNLVARLSQKLQTEILELWEEFEAKESVEAKLANAADKMEANIQHLLSDVKLWDEGDYKVQIGYKDSHFQFDPFISGLKHMVNRQTYLQMSEADLLSNFSSEQIAIMKASLEEKD